MLNQRYLDELRAQCETAVKTKDRSVEVDARTLATLIAECEQYRTVNLLFEGEPLPPRTVAA